MRNYYLFKWFAPATLGLSILCPAAALAQSIIVYTSSATFPLNLSAGNPNQDFGTVYIESDSATGWELRVRSSQGGKLSHGTHTSAIPYTLTVDGTPVSNLSGGSDVTALTTSTLTCSPPTGGCTLPVRATMLASDIAGKPSGAYSDTLVFTLINK